MQRERRKVGFPEQVTYQVACGRTEEVSLRRPDMQELWAKEESKGERGPSLASSYRERLRP